MPANKPTILIVDDEENVRKLLRQVLEGADYTVLTVCTGDEAFDKITSGDIDLVLLDIVMPGLDGYQTLGRIREESDIPVIMMTGLGDVTSLQSSLRFGADDYIKKPFRSKELLARINAKLRRSKN